MSASLESRIVIAEDGTATYQRVGRAPGKDGAPDRERLLETKRVDAWSLVPPQGELILLPPGCRFYRCEEGRSVFLIEEPPAIRTVRWEACRNDAMVYRMRAKNAHHLWNETASEFDRRLTSQREFRLAFPYVVKCYAFKSGDFHSLTMWYRNAPLVNERSELFHANVPNRNTTDGTICLTQAAKDMRSFPSIAQAIAFVEAEFWGGVWNSDWNEQFNWAAERFPEVASPWEWERMSHIDPMFPLRLDWRSAERTVGEVVQRGLGDEGYRPEAFKAFMRRVKDADIWSDAPRPSEDGHRISPARQLVLGMVPISVGDEITVATELSIGLPAGRYRIEWFGRDEDGGTRHVKLEGREPLPLIVKAKLITGVMVVRAPVDAPVLNGVPMEPGSMVFVSRGSWPDATCGYQIVEQAIKEPRGTVMAKFVGNHYFTVIGEGDASLPGLHCLPVEPKDTRGHNLATSITLSGGETVRVGDVFFSSDYGPQEVARFNVVEAGQTNRTFYSESGRQNRLDDEGHLTLPRYVLDQCPQQAVVGCRVVRVGQAVNYRQNYISTVLSFTPKLSNGRQYLQTERGWYELGVVASLPPMYLRDGTLHFGTDTYRPGYRFYHGTLRRYCTVASFKIWERACVDALTDRGEKLSFIKDGVLVSDIKPYLEHLKLKGILPIRRGMRLRLRKEPERQLLIPHVVEPERLLLVSHVVPPNRQTKAQVVLTNGTGFELTGRNAALFEARIRNVWRPLCASAPQGTDTTTVGFTRHFYTRRKNLRLFENHQERLGKPAGDDMYGRNIRIGDRVRASNFSSEARDTVRDYVRNGGTFTVVHSASNGSRWLYLYADTPVSRAEVRHETIGSSDLPSAWADDPQWWSHLAFARVDACEIITSPSQDR